MQVNTHTPEFMVPNVCTTLKISLPEDLYSYSDNDSIHQAIFGSPLLEFTREN